MSHVQWPLVALAFVIGLALTAALMVRRVKPEVVAAASTGKPVSGKNATALDPPTTRIPVARESPTTRIPIADELPTTEIPVAFEEDSPTTQIPAAKESATTKIPVVSYASYGPGSARAQPDGSGPAGWLVKGRTDTRLYYTPDDPTYDPTIAQVWFKDEESAKRAFFTPWRKSAKKR